MVMHCARCGRRGDWLERCPTFGREKEVFGYAVDELCRGCYRDLCYDPIVWDPELRKFSFNFFYSVAAHRSKEIAENHEIDNVLISYATKHNGRIGTEDTHFVDCGGDPQRFINSNGYETSHKEYLQYVLENTRRGDYWALRDYPCTTGVLREYNSSVEQFQDKTIEAHKELLKLAPEVGIKAQPIAALQGQSIKDYLTHIRKHLNAGTLTDKVAIGGIVKFGPHTQQQMILAIRAILPQRYEIHGYGVNLATLRMPGVLDALASTDSGNWYSRDKDNAQSSPWKLTTNNQLSYDKATYEYLDHRRTLNELLIEHAWYMDRPEETTTSETPSLSDYSNSPSPSEKTIKKSDEPTDFFDFGTPVDPIDHLDPEMKTIVSNFSLDDIVTQDTQTSSDTNSNTTQVTL